MLAHLLRFSTSENRRVLLVLPMLILFTLAGSAGAQSPLDNGAPMGLAPGSPEGSYALSGFETVNLYNGSLNFDLPLVHAGGRGTAGYTLQLLIQQKWVVNKDVEFDAYGNRSVSRYPYPLDASAMPGYGPLGLGPRTAKWMPMQCPYGAGYTT
jgi:hypothetical protein